MKLASWNNAAVILHNYGNTLLCTLQYIFVILSILYRYFYIFLCITLRNTKAAMMCYAT